MATAVTSAKLFANMAIKSYDHDPGGTGAVVVSGDGGTTKNYVSMVGFEYFGVIAFTSVSASSSGTTKLEILAAEDSSGTNATAVYDSGTISPAADSVGNQVVAEVTAGQIKEVGVAAGYNFTHVTARLTMSNAGDEAVVTFIRANAKFPQANLTANDVT